MTFNDHLEDSISHMKRENRESPTSNRLGSWALSISHNRINPFQSNFSANRIPAEQQKEYNLRYLLAKVRT